MHPLLRSNPKPRYQHGLRIAPWSRSLAGGCITYLVPAAPGHSSLLSQTKCQSRAELLHSHRSQLENQGSGGDRTGEGNLTLQGGEEKKMPALPPTTLFRRFSSTAIFFHGISTLEESVNCSICPTPHNRDVIIYNSSFTH